MALPDLAVPVLALTGVAGIGATLHYGSKAVVRIVAGITAIAAKDPKKSRAERALEVLKALGGGDSPPDDPPSPQTG